MAQSQKSIANELRKAITKHRENFYYPPSFIKMNDVTLGALLFEVGIFDDHDKVPDKISFFGIRIWRDQYMSVGAFELTGNKVVKELKIRGEN